MAGHEGVFARCHDRPMPRFNHRRSLFALRAAAAFFLLQRLLALLFIILVAYGAAVFRMDVIHAGLMAGGLWVGLRIAQFLMFTPCRCPLCLGAVFARSRCLPHRKASQLLGSHRLSSSLGILFKGRFKCTYCGTRLSMVVADRRPDDSADESIPVRFRSLGGPGRPGILRISSRSRRTKRTRRSSKSATR
jgi:hypothetical protein